MNILLSLSREGQLLQNIAKNLDLEIEVPDLRRFPDGETYIKINTDVKDRVCIICESLDHPNEKFLNLVFLAETLRDLGAKKILLISPYLAYMRQDQRFHPGEGITSKYFAKLLSTCVDYLLTVDPHLHRIKRLNEIYSIPTQLIHATKNISEWIRENVREPVLIGPDAESEQWVREVAKLAGASYLILEKIRHGDREVEVSIPELQPYKKATPVLIDDIISTGKTMIETIRHLKKLKMPAPICIGIHAIFAENAYELLLEAGANKIITCNSIPHPSNEIDLSEAILKVLDLN